MALPRFFIPQYDDTQQEFVLDEETSRHVVQVLRMKQGEHLHLTDGRGHLVTAVISDDHRKHCRLTREAIFFHEPAARRVTIAISLLKNANRFEWFLEKATEMGVNAFIPLLCDRTEKEKFRHERMLQIVTSAMLQSQQTWLPALSEPLTYQMFLRSDVANDTSQRFIAHCEEGNKRSLTDELRPDTGAKIILIGPEGDFTPAEIQQALEKKFAPVSLGETRLRTETAGIAAAALMCLV